jgi:hypothetical protein
MVLFFGSVDPPVRPLTRQPQQAAGAIDRPTLLARSQCEIRGGCHPACGCIAETKEENMRDLKAERDAICGQVGWGWAQENGRTFVLRTLQAEQDLQEAKEAILALQRSVAKLEQQRDSVTK